MSQKAKETYFNSVYEEFANQVFTFILMRTSHREVAKDLTQETFMRFWDSLRAGKEMSNVRAYLYTIARHQIIDWYRKKKSLSLEKLVEEGSEFNGDEEDRILWSAESKLIRRKLGELPEEERELLTMRYVEDIPPRDIAEILDISPNATSVRLTRALEKFKKILKYDE